MQNNLDIFISVLLAIILILIATQLVGRLFFLLRQPRVVGEMVAGVLLGPTCVGYFFPSFSHDHLGKEIMPFIFVVSNLGLSVYMFLVGLEIDFRLFDRKMVRQSSVLSLGNIIVPFILGAFAAYLYYDKLKGEVGKMIPFCIFLGASLAITAFPMLARILEEQKLVKTKLGTMALLSASIQDVVSWVFLAFVIAMAKSNDAAGGIRTLILGTIFVFGMFFLVRPVLQRFFSNIRESSHFSYKHFQIIILLLLLSTLTTDYIGLYSVFGGFVFGLIIPRNEIIIKALTDKVRDISIALLLPLFFAFSGLNANMLALQQLSYFYPCLVIVIFSFIGKYVVTAFMMRYSGFSWSESSAVGGLMNARGLMELIIANVGLMYGVISGVLYSILILTAIISTLLAMPIYNLSMRARKKNVIRNSDSQLERA